MTDPLRRSMARLWPVCQPRAVRRPRWLWEPLYVAIVTRRWRGRR